MPRTPTADVRQALVDAAATVLERDGVAGLTVRAVAAEAGVAPMGVYNHLDGKGGLTLAVLQRGFDELRAAVTPDPALEIGERIMTAGRGYRAFACAYPQTYALMFSSTDPSVDPAALEPHAQPAFEALVTLVQAGQQAGIVRADDPHALALQIWSAVHGAVSLELTRSLDEAGKGPEALVPAEVVYESVLAMVARGIAPDPA
jgi:AcrR family transcriptional regulator